jgi:hypothetical protein
MSLMTTDILSYVDFCGGITSSTLLRYCGQVFLLLAGCSPATYFMCWCWWSITNIYIRCILWKAIDEFWIVRVEFCWFWKRTSMCASCLCWALPFFVNTVGVLMAWASLLCWSVCVVSSVEGFMSTVCAWTQVVLSPTASLFAFHYSIRWAFLLLVEGESCFFFGQGW